MMKLWWKLKLWRWTHKARVAKARWVATKTTLMKGSENPISRKRESEYCDTVMRVKTYRLLLDPELPVATAKETSR